MKDKDMNVALNFLEDVLEINHEVDASIPIRYESPNFSMNIERIHPFSAKVLIPLVPSDARASLLDLLKKREKYRRALFNNIKDKYL